jgi:prophage regulatory protein
MQHRFSKQADQPIGLADNPPPSFLRMPMVMRMTGLARSTIYRLVAEKKFPGPVKLSDRAVAWRREDLILWSEGRRPSMQ